MLETDRYQYAEFVIESIDAFPAGYVEGAEASLTLSGTNLFNEEYYWGGGSSFAEVADPGRPRQVLFTTSFSFR